MDGNVDLNIITNGWQVLVVLIVVGVPAFFAWQNGKQAKKISQDTLDELNHQSNPNSGKSLKDSLNRIEAHQVRTNERLDTQNAIQQDQARRLAALENTVERRGTLEPRKEAE